MRRPCRPAGSVVLALALALPIPATASVASAPDLVVLTETGESRNGVPVYARHPDPGEVVRVLTRGFSGRLLRLYRYEQEYLRRETGSRPEPAYLLLSGTQGGFPRFGFILDGQNKEGVGYVDLHKSGRAAGRFGAMDQIFPHELLHVIVRQLAGAPGRGGSNQMHAVGVRTDPIVAFQEGFAEHAQVMAVDDPDAVAATKALIADDRYETLAAKRGGAYRRDLRSRWLFPGPTRMGFILWYSGVEQIWRYVAVKTNAFAREAELPDRLLAGRDPYRAYLLRNVLPGDATGAPKPVPVLLSTEGVVSGLFHRLAIDETLRRRYREDAFYARFGSVRSEVSPLENVYLKLFHVLHVAKPADTASLLLAYASIFPDEAAAVEAVVRDALLGQALDIPPAIWLANRDFQTGATLFDQFRSMPRTHTFDLNAATVVDLVGVPGVDRRLAESILDDGPYAGIADLARVPGMPPDLVARFEAMAQEMSRLASDADDEADLDLGTLVRSFVWRALAILFLASVLSAVLYRRARACPAWRAAVNGSAASLLVLALAWMTTGTAAPTAALAPLVCFGAPAAAWHAFRRRGLPDTARVLAAWIAATLPAVLIVYL